MTIQSKFRKAILTGLLAATAIMPLAGRAAETPDRFNVRNRVESTTQNESTQIKSTVGFSEIGKGETSRVYNFTGNTSDGKSIDYSAIGLTTPTLKLGELEESLILLGNVGDREGAGLEWNQKIAGNQLTFNADNLYKGDTAARHLGGQITQTIGQFMPGLGFDSLTTDMTVGKKTITTGVNHFLANIVYNVTDNDQIGAAFRLSDTKTTDDKSAFLYYMHHGKDEKIGGRAFVRYDWNEQSNTQLLTWEGILTENPTFIKDISGPALIGRSTRDAFCYWASPLTNPLLSERTPYPDRSKSGLVLAASGSLSTVKKNTTGYLRGDAGYKLAVTDGIELSPTVTYKIQIDQRQDTGKFGPGILAKFGKNQEWVIEAQVLERVSGQAKPEGLVSISWRGGF